MDSADSRARLSMLFELPSGASETQKRGPLAEAAIYTQINDLDRGHPTPGSPPGPSDPGDGTRVTLRLGAHPEIVDLVPGQRS